MRFPWMIFLVIFYVFCYHSSTGDKLPTRGKVPIVFDYANEIKRNALRKRQSVPEDKDHHSGLSLHMLLHDAARHMDDTHPNNTLIEYITEEDDPVHGPRRVKRFGHYGRYHGHHHGHHHHQQPVSLDFGCNSDNFHEHITKQHDASGSSDGVTSAPSSSSSSSDDKRPLSLFIKRPQHQQQRPHHHGPHLTFRCNAHNHHIFKHFRRSSK